MKHFTVKDLEAMTPPELAELLANIVLVLRRMPSDVALKDLQAVEKPPIDADGIAAGVRHEPKSAKAHTGNLPAWTTLEE